MYIYQFVYTRLSREESPFKKSGFQVGFYPLELLTRDDVSEIEKRILFDTSYQRDNKKTIFYYKIKDKYYLVIIIFKNLPEDKDEFGRGGIFLAHGFLFPPEIWKQFPGYKEILDIINDYVFDSRKSLFSSNFINKSTGNINPIEISDWISHASRSFEKNSLLLTNDFERDVLIILNKLINNSNNFALLIKGKQEKILDFIDKISAYIPSYLKHQFSCDTNCENAVVINFPIKVIGFENIPPTGKDFIKIDIVNNEFVDDDKKYFIKPETPYEKWLYYWYRNIKEPADIDTAQYLSSLLMHEKQIFQPAILKKEIIKQFIEVNKDFIINKFIQYYSGKFGEKIVNELKNDIESLLNFFMNNSNIENLSNKLGEIIITEKLTPKNCNCNLTEELVNSGNIFLNFIGKVWKGEKIDIDELNKLDEQKKDEFIKYILISDLDNKEWIFGFLLKDKETFNKFLSIYNIEEIIYTYFINITNLDRDKPSIGYFLLKNVINLNKLYELLKGKINIKDIIEESLKGGLLKEKEAKELIKWAKNNDIFDEKHPYIQAFLYPKKGIPDIVLENEDTKKLLIEWLFKYHNFKEKEILAIINEYNLNEKEFFDISKLLFKLTIRSNNLTKLLENIKDIIEESLKGGLLKEKEAKELIKWAKNNDIFDEKHPYIQAFLYPKKGIPDIVLENEDTKKLLIEWLFKYHNFKEKEILAIINEYNLNEKEYNFDKKEKKVLNRLIFWKK